MVDTASEYNFANVIDDFFATRTIEGRNAALITSTIRNRALVLLAHPDVRYMPAFKILDLLAALVNIAAAVADAPQLRPNEIQALLRESLSDTAPLVQQFLLDAALERARYEPLMLSPQSDRAAERELILQRRWAAMRAAHQEKAHLPDSWIDVIDNTVERALAAEEFRQFRQGPLLQLFAEMLATARKLQQQNQPLKALESALSEHAPLWRRYALKAIRYGEKKRSTPPLQALQPPTHRLH